MLRNTLLNILNRIQPHTALALTIAAAAGTGCGGISPGDYVIYRVAVSDAAQSPDCFAGGAIPPDEAEDTTTLRSSGAFILYAGANDSFFLDTGTGTVEGSRSGDDFSFSGRTVDVSFQGGMNETRVSSELRLDIDFSLDGELIDGTLVDTQSVSCSGPAGSCPDPATTSCTQTSDFVGTEVNDVDIEHGV